ncbi:uncharacterized protein M6B38_193185 [Iris pallida]|uniref:Uncharacterized protein n=1 Tax=Iris pallida TaxID=29817 RepID=A0AAX6EDB8_IRIPA|nr:uncharacterized protein M6B38_193185 [Iris pallida]
MGNCQAAEAATVLIQHPCGGRVERIYCSLTANQVMTSNPGHYVAVIVTSKTTTAPVKYLKLLRPNDTLHLGYVYRLVSFQEVLKEFATKKHVKLSRLLVGNKEEKTRSKRGEGEEGIRMDINPEISSAQVDAEEEEEDRSSGRVPSGRPVPRAGQWRPALESIAEIGSYTPI